MVIPSHHILIRQLLVESVSGTDGHYNSKGQAHNSSSKYSLSIQCPHQWTLQGVFIGGVTPPTYIYSSTLLQWPYSWNITGHTRNFSNTSSVCYSSDGPTTADIPLRPSPRRLRDLLLTPRWCSHRLVFAGLRLPFRRQAKAMCPVIYSSPWRSHRPVPASLRLSTWRRAKAGIFCVHSRWLQCFCCPVFAHLWRPDRRWCPQQ